MRLFVSIDLPDELADAVREAQELFEGASGLSFTDPEQAHVTMKFLGDVEEERLDEVTAAVERGVDRGVDHAGIAGSFPARFAGLGVFPSLDYISVVWLGVEVGDDEMTALHECIEDETTDLGFDPEENEFTPHVTLARMEHAGGKERVQEVVENRHPTVGEMAVEEVRLTKSDLTEDGPEYSTVESFPL
ncbi:RNA 2',3'-cyclic phosphodiesterase [Halostella sp. JP-L12]|uniref:RNA 2',3'-cyclic phosphodiesterase n=1 Tax=Halostella TaxID=1843185 RepID=UPI000EF7A1D7|nr:MULTISPECIES: RNA 2',3'-cyclic phosphodiesterase [Halostella]NHN46368.1 RNA 2',3'-cyclic phosphodiesterase [Halostella sp. JP-L12]